jgi:CubicO group peptidase (beta-lactamase class C family)
VTRDADVAVTAARRAAVAYLSQWLAFQVRSTWQPGVSVAVTHHGRLVHASAHGVADPGTGAPLTPAHRFRIASHSKTFTAVGILALRAQGRLRLDDPVGTHVEGLHPAVAAATVADVLTHTAGLTRDGDDTGQWADRRPFLDAGELRAVLAQAPVLDRAARFKYSNIGYGLAGLVIEGATGEPYRDWIVRHVIRPAGLADTTPDVDTAAGPIAVGHSGALPLGRRVAIPGRNDTGALAAATGFVSTASDVARFVAQLDPAASRSVLDVTSRRELLARRWAVPDDAGGRSYGLGTITVAHHGTATVGHSGAFQGYASRTALVPGEGWCVSMLTNAIDGPASPWCDGALSILRRFACDGAPTAAVRSWTGRWWDLWSVTDLVPVGDRVLAAAPAQADPFADAPVLAVTGRDTAVIERAGGFSSHGQRVRRVRAGGRGPVVAVEFAGGRKLPEEPFAAELADRYGR